MAERHYCTYFDHRYLPRGIAMMDSIRRYDPTSRFHILALDAKCKDMLDALAIQGVEAVPLSELEAHDPELLRARQDRSLIEYYFTCTPCFPAFLLKTRPNIEMITYLDADTWFFSDPAVVYEEIGDASVAVTPHRFSPERAELVRYGTFNVGWISWRNDAIGRRCLDDYRRDCIAWCHDRLDGDRFADQKYLDKWPQAYGAALRSIDHPGVNAAAWNVNNYTVEKTDAGVFLSGTPLVFWHYHALKERPDGQWTVALDQPSLDRNPQLLDAVIRPYIAQLGSIKGVLQQRFGDYEEKSVDIRYDANRPKATETAPAQTVAAPAASAPTGTPASAGYQVIDRARAQAMGEASAEAWLHDDVAAGQEAAYRPLLEAMKAGRPRLDLAVAAQAVAATGIERPSLLEVGCGSGYYADVFAHLLQGRVDYTGLDYSPAMIELARRSHPQNTFEVGDATALPFPDRSFDVVMNGVSLMHVVDYEAAIREARRVARKFVIFHTAILIDDRPTSYLAKSAYGRPTHEVIINTGEFRALLAKYGMYVAAAWDSIPYDPGVLGAPTRSQTIVCHLLDESPAARPLYLNAGCGSHFHPAWVNVDMSAAHPAVMAYDILKGLPYPDETFDVVYHSHMLEHLPKWQAPGFLAECRRVLKPGGVLRVVIPDLERICRLYLENLDRADAGDQEAAGRYHWMLLELLDQMVRAESGGEMARYWRQNPMPAEDFVIERVGAEVKGFLDRVRAQPAAPMPPRRVPTPEELGRFHKGGEIHQWMYDRFSLRCLLSESGFEGARVVGATESAIPGFASFALDAAADGTVRKPDSLFMEARKA